MYTKLDFHNFAVNDSSGSKNYHYKPFNQMFIFLFLALQFDIIDKLQSKFIDTDLGP